MAPRTLWPAVALVATVSLALPSPAAAAAPARDESVMVKVGPRAAAARAVARRHGLAVLRHLPQIGWAELGRADATGSTRARSAAAALPALRGDPAVRAVDYERPGERARLHFTPRDPLFDQQVAFGDGTPGAWHFYKPNFPAAWDRTTGNAGVRVGVIDSEFDTDNPDLKEKLLVRHNAASGSPQYRTGDIKAKPGDTFHGSHTSGLVGARTDNGLGVAGACFDCGIIAVKVGSDSAGTFVSARFLGDVTEGVLFATDNGASVINMSLGGPRPFAPLQDAINYAASRNVVLVASAGNSQQNNPGVPNYPAAFGNVIAVAATDRGDQIAEFSTNGLFVDVAAPGKEVISTTDIAEPGASTLERQAPVAALSVKSGTSMASPIVAGLAALMRTVRPDLTAGEVEAIMKGTARDLGAIGFDQVYGAGRIDAGAAVAAAIGYTRPAPPPPPPPPAPPAPPADRTGPTVRVSGAVRVTRRTLRFRVLCPTAEASCTGSVVVSATRVTGPRGSRRRVTFGRRGYAARGGQAKTVTVRFGPTARATLRQWSRARFTVTVKAADSLGNVAVTRTRRTLGV